MTIFALMFLWAGPLTADTAYESEGILPQWEGGHRYRTLMQILDLGGFPKERDKRDKTSLWTVIS